MKIKRSVTYLLCLTLLIFAIGSGCSQKGATAAADGGQAAVEQNSPKEALPAETSPEEAPPENSGAGTEEAGAEQADEADSPWKLISDSTVETKVNYAGFLNESIGVTVGYSGETSYTLDGGKTWSKSGNVSYCRYGIDLLNESFIFDSGNGGENLLSRDGGRSWIHMGNFPLKNGNFNSFLSVVDEKNIYIGAIGSLGVSSDGGMSWTDLPLPEGCTKIAGMFFLTPETGYLLNGDGTLFITKDACATWTTEKIDLAGESFANSKVPPAAVNFQDEDHGMIVYATKSFKLICIKTEDGGRTWETVPMPRVSCYSPYISRDGKFLTLSSVTRQICLYKLEET
jgi:photosystem II stability/assembly factor-like uncharacterized protein